MSLRHVSGSEKLGVASSVLDQLSTMKYGQCSGGISSPVLNDSPPRLWGAHKVPQVVIGDDNAVCLLRQVEQEPEKAWGLVYDIA